jgi:predicted TIM-barrel fold metal-dependent hydrolase
MQLIIDVHAHIFNARDIPLEGYLCSREPITLIEKLSDSLGLRFILIKLIAKCIRRELHPEKNKHLFSNVNCGLVRAFIYLFMRQYLQWVDTLSKDVIDITKEMVDTFEKDKIDLYVPLMIDYEYWFKNTPDNPLEKQIENVYENIILPYKGEIHPFVPFDPARELAFRKNMLNPDRKPELHGSLQLVKDAIENKGFIGVKLYNAMGYKPFNNVTVDDKRRRRIKLHKEMGYHVFKGEEYDKVLSELYDYCVENEVPITTHCGMCGIESYNNASFDFGQAVFWHEVLSQRRYRNLRLNLAHFGWDQKHRYRADVSWVRDICEMLGEYEHLYTDVAHHEVVVKRDMANFQSDYFEICRDFPVVKKKLLFGIDWHVIKRVKNFENFKEDYLKVLRHKNLFTDTEIDDFLGGNALRFLGLLPGGKNRRRLEKFYECKNIELPEWFKASGQ